MLTADDVQSSVHPHEVDFAHDKHFDLKNFEQKEENVKKKKKKKNCLQYIWLKYHRIITEISHGFLELIMTQSHI